MLYVLLQNVIIKYHVSIINQTKYPVDYFCNFESHYSDIIKVFEKFLILQKMFMYEYKK